METNLSVTSKPSTPSFEGKLSWKTKRLANKLGIKEMYQEIADQAHKKTVFYLTKEKDYFILSARNKKLCTPKEEIGHVSIADGIKALKKFIADINPHEVDKSLIERDISGMKNDANFAYSSGEFSPVLRQAKKNMKVQKETGINIPFLDDLYARREKYVEELNKSWAENVPESPYPIAEDVH